MGRKAVLLKAGKKRLDRFLDALEAARIQPGEEPVHDLRVAIRRLLAFLDLARISHHPPATAADTGISTALRSIGLLDVVSTTPASPSRRAPCIYARLHPLATKRGEKCGLAETVAGGKDPHFRKLPDALKELMRPLGRLRDTHVKLIRIERFAPQADPCTRQYRLAVMSDSEKWEAAVVRILKGADPRRFRKAFREFPLSHPTPDGIEAVAMGRLQAMETEVKRLSDRFLRERTPRSLHDMRLAFKRYRYTAEAISALLPGFLGEAGSGMHGFQTLLGEIHDCDVLIAEARHFREKVVGIPGPQGELEAAAGKARDEFLKGVPEILRKGSWRLENRWSLKPTATTISARS